MSSTDDPEKFKKRWNSHIDQLNRLKLSVPADEWERLTDAQKELKKLVEEAAENAPDE
jgi:hypothetical protein